MTSEWVSQEMLGLSVGDKRLDKRVKTVLSAVAKNPGQAFTRQFETAAELKACYNLFDSDLVSPEALLEPHRKRTIERAKEQDVVIVASDSSSTNYTTRSSNPDTGYLSTNNTQGFLLHTSLVTTLERLPLGVLASKFWAREKEKPKQKAHRDLLPIEEKESFKWLESYRTSQELADALPHTQVINVCDKEGDILEVWQEVHQNIASKANPAHLLTRSQHDRVVVPTPSNPNRRLRAYVSSTAPRGQTEFALMDRRTHKVKRVVTQDIRATSITVPSSERSGVKQAEFSLNVVLMTEVDPPEGKQPVNWCLVTTLPIETEADVEKIVQAYLARWDVEILFRTFKSGCRVEERSLRTAKRLYSMFALFLIVAWRINMLTRIAKADPDLPCTELFSDLEWRSAVAACTKCLKVPEKPPTIQEILIMVATLGGYLNRKSDPPPGPKALWKGLEFLRGFSAAYHLFNQASEANSDISVKNTYG